MTATHPAKNRIALVFDFDGTLAPGSVDAVLDVLGVDQDRWWRERFEPLAKDGWDEILARGFALIETARERGRPLSDEVFGEAAARLEPYPGVADMFERLRRAAQEDADGVTLTFHILSSGYVDIITRTAIAERFETVWGSAFHTTGGEAVSVKRTITHPEKARYLAALGKGLGIEGANAPQDVGRPVKEEDMAVPFDQMIYVGDGKSDLDAFEFLENRGGLAIAVLQARDPAQWSAQAHMREERRVENLAHPDFRDGGELFESLRLAVRSAAARVALRRLSGGE